MAIQAYRDRHAGYTICDIWSRDDNLNDGELIDSVGEAVGSVLKLAGRGWIVDDRLDARYSFPASRAVVWMGVISEVLWMES